METTATAPVTATVKAKGGNKKKASAPKANAKATTTTANKEKKKKKNKNITTAAAAAGTDDYESMPRVPRKTDRRFIDNDNDSVAAAAGTEGYKSMNHVHKDNDSNMKNNNIMCDVLMGGAGKKKNDDDDDDNNNDNDDNDNDDNVAAAAGTEGYKSMYNVHKDNDSNMKKDNNKMRDVLMGGAGKKKENDDDDDDDDDFNDDDFLGSLGLDFNISLYADEEGDIVNDSYYCDGKGRGRPRHEGCPHKEPDTTGMNDSKREEVMEEYIKLRKAWNDKKLNARRAGTPIDVEDCIGVTVKSLRRMVDVEERRMKVGDTFPDKETVSLRIVEEINISDSSDATINRSDNRRMFASGTNFTICVLYNLHYGWRVDKCSIVKEKVEVVPNKKVAAHDIQVGNPDADSEDDNEDEDGDTESGELYHLIIWTQNLNCESICLTNYKFVLVGDSRQRRTPFKAEWLLPLLRSEISETPNMSNKKCRAILLDYIKDKFITEALLQNARTLTKQAIFGNPSINVQYATALKEEMEKQGHSVDLVAMNALTLINRIADLVVTEEVEKQKLIGLNMTGRAKQKYLSNWMRKNTQLLTDNGLMP